MKALVTGVFIFIVLSSIFPAVMQWVLWGAMALIFIGIIIAAPRNPKP